MRARQDDRLADGPPMLPVRCRRCRAEVLVRKSSWEQTSIQWTQEAAAACQSLAGDRHATCPDLRAAIQEATLAGVITIAGG